MEEIFSKVVSVILGCVLLFIVPVKIMEQRQENMQQTYIMSETICFVDSVCNKGILYSELYLDYSDKITQNNKIYKIKLYHIKDNDNEEIKYNAYTEEILSSLENEDCYKLCIGDLFRVEIVDENNNPIVFYGGCIKDEDY